MQCSYLPEHLNNGLPKLGLALALCVLLSACTGGSDVRAAEMLTGGNSSLGRQLIYSYNCGSCHTIPGIAEATGTVGPPLRGIANRNYIAGELLNTPENLSRWVREPQAVEVGTAMPNLGITKKQASDITAYLYTLR